MHKKFDAIHHEMDITFIYDNPLLHVAIVDELEI